MFRPALRYFKKRPGDRWRLCLAVAYRNILANPSLYDGWAVCWTSTYAPP